MNQQKINAVRKYLYEGLERHLKEKQKTEDDAVTAQFATQLREVNKQFEKTEKQANAYQAAIRNLTQAIEAANVKAYVNGNVNVREASINLNSSTRNFASINHISFYCSERHIEAAKEAVRKIDRFLLQLILDGDSSSVEEFLSNLLRDL